MIFPARELLPTPEVRARAAALVGEQPWGREHWERLAEGLVFDGMESWLPWLAAEERLLTDLLPREALVVLVEPKRLRDRAADVVAEEDDLARTLAVTWGANQERGFPRLHLEPERLLSAVGSAAMTMVNVPETPDTPALAASPWAPSVGHDDALGTRLQHLLSDGYRVGDRRRRCGLGRPPGRAAPGVGRRSPGGRRRRRRALRDRRTRADAARWTHRRRPAAARGSCSTA